jgi:hypothetical protein
MRPAVLSRLVSMRLAVVAQHLHSADTDRVPAVRNATVQLENGRRISPKTIASIRELVHGAYPQWYRGIVLLYCDLRILMVGKPRWN